MGLKQWCAARPHMRLSIFGLAITSSLQNTFTLRPFMAYANYSFWHMTIS
ncbi:hypothetical protein THOE12_50160 [Vibrio rotiferianus]|nr:hypothetical protein THOE12_50160 [Vibrio rotiferianus]